ncbi:PepSY-like domain-containing protein [Neolewinella antarctica]|uniref:Putative beta-lactamase-inhibitor-like PepSY-like domain-containing protein n=1 Tax=Neolewinella antarctica TaxID=442734 RepID=A0ABX0XBR5_9BACT|nr:PepSY-like domain-containing protein [Neolewinella antarctica]NJC26637.1 hypothetical protein [Neolewinella antarctica]
MSKFFFCCCLAITLAACGDVDDSIEATAVPAAVMSAFNTAYPNATEVHWERDGDGYEVDFEYNGEEMEVDYDSQGTALEVED